MFLVYLGVAIFIIGSIWYLIAAFKVNILWGVGCFLLLPVSLAFLILHWNDAKNPFFLQLSGIIAILISASFIDSEDIITAFINAALIIGTLI